ncbi:hypothetical protein K488DRAFT_70016 [Vararia minispora EC-137]|uniref:Uncharacterized protein n=1 Tax=Vararia minispora EC-137 TaxID=1314806 RepID=A0ACB8QPA1_9AGAM|nr:hypothetical protein K488DRAFT_70016 [Vararia minispora EC-137]
MTSPTRSHSFDLPPAPYASPVFCMPDVIVHPPEEEQTSFCAPFLAFAAADARPAPGPSTPELACAAARLNAWQSPQPTPARRSAFHLPRPASALGIFTDGDWPSPSPSSSQSAKRPHAPAAPYEPENDTLDVIEVVKVPRAHASDDVGARRLPPKRGLALAARLRSSLRVVGKKPRAGAAREQAPPPPPLVMPPPVESEASAGLRRSRSTRLARPLSQLFTFGSGDVAGLDREAASTTSRLSSLASGVEAPTLEEPDTAQGPPSTKTARRRFSFVSLQTLFVPPASSAPTPPALSSPTRTTESLPSSTSSSEPRTPPDVADDFSLTSIPPFTAAAGPQDGGLSARKGACVDDVQMGDVSFEMQLDSLHFENLSFDVDGFDISR